jgi:hypothetical protein
MRTAWIPLTLVVAAACSDTTGSGTVLDAPSDLTSVTLDGAVALSWSDNAYLGNPNLFKTYRVYSTSYNLDAAQCGTNWSLEGTTVAPEFLAGALQNGVPRCFSVTSVSTDDVESARSPQRFDTPRPDFRNVALFARQAQDVGSGFRFWDDVNSDGTAQASELGLVRSGSSGSIDFYVDRASDGTLWLKPVRAGTGVEFYSSSAPVEDLTSIDFAPDQTYPTSAVQAVPGYGYVFSMSGGDGFARFGAVRVTHVGTNMLILDWAFQTDPGNPELKTMAR